MQPAEFAGFQEGMKLVNELAAELSSVMSVREHMPAHHWARVVVRTTFAMLEGFIGRFKGRALEVQKYGSVTFSPKLLRILEEGRSVATEDGSVEWEHIRPRTPENLKASVKAFSKALKTDTPLGGAVPLPREFVVALGARNRVTHPKNLQDLVVTRDELVAVGEILKWFMEMSTWAKDQELRHIEELKTKMNKDFDEMRARLRADHPDTPGSGTPDDSKKPDA
jgi:hypothetical protein